jgi:hypothetical protein
MDHPSRDHLQRSTMPLYIVLKKLRVEDGNRYPGDLVPEAAEFRGLDGMLMRGELLVLSDATVAAIRGAAAAPTTDDQPSTPDEPAGKAARAKK